MAQPRQTKAQSTYLAGESEREALAGVSLSLDTLASRASMSDFETDTVRELHFLAPPGYWDDLFAHIVKTMCSNEVAYEALATSYDGWHATRSRQEAFDEAKRAHVESKKAKKTGTRAVNRASSEDFTEDAAGLRCAESLVGRFLHLQTAGWFAFKGHVWAKCDDKSLAGQGTLPFLRELAKQDGWRDQANRLLSASYAQRVAWLAATSPSIAGRPEDFDSEPYVLHTPAGPVDLRTGAVNPAAPSNLNLRSTRVVPDFESAAPLFAEFLEYITGGDEDLQVFLQGSLGLSLIGTNLEQVLFMAYGDGKNGKSTLFELVLKVLGVGDSGYGASFRPEHLLEARFNSHPTHIAALAGRRLVVAKEPNQGQFAVLDESKVKELTSQDLLKARLMRQDEFEFSPSHTLWLQTNELPRFEAQDHGMRRRLVVVPFPVRVAPDVRKPAYDSTLFASEGPQVLAWLIRGAQLYLAAERLPVSAAVETATSEFLRNSNSAIAFVEEELEATKEDGCHLTNEGLLDEYETWCEDNSLAVLSSSMLKQAVLRVHRVEQRNSRKQGGRHYPGLRFRGKSD